MNPTLILASLALLVFIGLALEELFRRTGIPDVLLLLLLGIGLGAAGLFDPTRLNGLDRIFTTAALVVILFEGAVRLRLSELRSALAGVLRITLLGFGFATLTVGAVGFLLTGDVLAGLLLGVIVGGTSSAVVIPMVQSMDLQANTRTSLALESAFTDVLSIVLALALTGALAAGTIEVGAIGSNIGLGLLGATLIGFGLGLLWAFGLRALRQRRASFLALGAAVFLVYALAEALGTFGAIACLAFGITLGNAPALARGEGANLDIAPGERLFLAEVAFLLKVFFFVYLGAALDLASWQPWFYGLLATAAIFLSRPLAVRLGLSKATTPQRDARVASVLVPRGLAAAVLASVPAQMGVDPAIASTIESGAVGVILLSIVGASVLVFCVDTPPVRAFYDRFFRSYPESVAEGPGEVATVATPMRPAPGEITMVPLRYEGVRSTEDTASAMADGPVALPDAEVEPTAAEEVATDGVEPMAPEEAPAVDEAAPGSRKQSA